MIGSGDRARAEAILGVGSIEMLSSGDTVADRAHAEKVKMLIGERLDFREEGARSFALIGPKGWTFPLPLVKGDDGWRFDVAAGKEELLTRRIGRNELVTIAAMHAFVDAQRECASVGRDDRPPCYAARFWSTPGLPDGLYWEVAEGEPESPMGPRVAEASSGGYTQSVGGPGPYHGYLFHILTAQGASAPGGAKSYLDEGGLLAQGFALVAWPAAHGNSGVKTFMVNQQGIVFERDLGPETPEKAAAIQAYDPDRDWTPVTVTE